MKKNQKGFNYDHVVVVVVDDDLNKFVVLYEIVLVVLMLLVVVVVVFVDLLVKVSAIVAVTDAVIVFMKTIMMFKDDL